MLFVLQKIVWFLLLPPASLLLLMLTGLILLRKHRQAGRACLLSGLVLLYVLSLGHTADLILKPLEGRYRPLAGTPGSVDAVVVPGGGSVDRTWLGAAPVPNAETEDRLVLGARLANRLGVPLVLCGGNGEPFTTKVNDADAMALEALALGVPTDRMIVESRSRNTLENSYAVRGLVRGNRIVLATSAYYMRRAKAMFEQRGFTVIPAPTYFLAQQRRFTFASFIPRASDLARSSTGLAEWASLAWWGLRGEL